MSRPHPDRSPSAAESWSPMLEIADLHVAYGRVEAVRGVSLALEPGQIVSVIGPNGAGKTTLLGAAMGLLPSKGTLRFEGEDLHALDVEARVERGLCLVPEKRELFGELSVLDNLRLGGYAKRAGGAPARQRLEAVYARFPRLAERRSQRADTLSGGERQMLALGMALLLRPRLLMIDEPSIGLAPKLVAQIFDIITRIRDEFGAAILVVEQQAQQILRIADEVLIIRAGRLISQGPVEAYRSEDTLRSIYLSGSNVHERME